MTDPALSAMIREVLSEELAKLRSPEAVVPSGVQRETVKIANDADLNEFARRFLAMMDDGSRRRDFEAGKLTFGLEGKGAAQQAAEMPTGPVHRIERGFISERQIDRLPGEVKRLVAGKAVRITPLARDRARQRGIVIERMEP